MKPFIFKKNGMPVTDPLPKSCKSWYDRVFIKNKASMIIVDGFVGEGKTTLAVHMADIINKIKGFDDIVFEDQLAKGGEDFIDKFGVAVEKKLPVVIYDEAGDFNRRGSLTKFNMNLNRVFQTYRSSKVVVILVLPSVGVLDSDLFTNGIVRSIIRVYGRRGNYGKWKMFTGRTMFYLLKQLKNSKVVVKSDPYNFYFPFTRGFFCDLPTERSALLDEFSTAAKQEIIHKARVGMSGLLNYNDLGEKVNRSAKWVSNMINKYEIQHDKVFHKAKYFSPDVVNTLLDIIDKIHDKN